MSTALAVRYGKQAERGIGAGGEKTTETLLWENPHPSSSFAGQDVTLNQKVDSFTYLKIIYSINTSAAEITWRTVVVPVWDKTGTEYAYKYVNSSTAGYRGALAVQNSNGTVRARTFWILTGGEKIHFFANTAVGGSSTLNTGVIPRFIYGIKGGYGSTGGGGGSDIPVYTGAYEVTPKANTEQTLYTSGKQMTDNVTVHEVPYYETSNISGTTVYIANEV